MKRQDLSILQIVAGQLAVALENAALYKQAEDELQKMNDEMKSYIRTGCDDCLRKGEKISRGKFLKFSCRSCTQEKAVLKLKMIDAGRLKGACIMT